MIPRSNSTLYLPMFTYLLFFSLFSESDGKVSLELYYESLCPESANVVTNYLSEVFNTDLNSIVNVKLFPWGNTKLHPWLPDEPVTNASYYCQHGEFECFLDTVEACVIDIWPEPSKHFSFIHCVEELVTQDKYKEWESCFEKSDLDPEPIKHCYTSEYGEKLELQYGVLTRALQPPHMYVPWLVLNGEPLGWPEYYNLTSYICDAYKGSDVPESCAKVSNLRQVKAKPKHSVCKMERELSTWEK